MTDAIKERVARRVAQLEHELRAYEAEVIRADSAARNAMPLTAVKPCAAILSASKQNRCVVTAWGANGSGGALDQVFCASMDTGLTYSLAPFFDPLFRREWSVTTASGAAG